MTVTTSTQQPMTTSQTRGRGRTQAFVIILLQGVTVPQEQLSEHIPPMTYRPPPIPRPQETITFQQHHLEDHAFTYRPLEDTQNPNHRNDAVKKSGISLYWIAYSIKVPFKISHIL